MPLIRRNLILVGGGLHYREKYHSVLEKSGARIVLLIDLQSSQETILKFFSDKALQPMQTLFLEERFRNRITPEEIELYVAAFNGLSSVEAVIISTEPKARKPYAIWAAKRGLSQFIDKPITAFSSLEGANTLLDDFDEIHSALKTAKVDAVVSCERRANPGYKWLIEYLKSFIYEMKIPITAIDIHYAGGIFNLPAEYEMIENHPFQYGYGILLHSGYHYIDLLVQFLSLNDSIVKRAETSIFLETMVSRPGDYVQGGGNYFPFMTSQEIEKLSSVEYQTRLINYGETDLLLMGQARKEGRVTTNFSVRLFGTSISRRQEKNRIMSLPGRARQEYVVLHLGHHCSIHLSSMPLRKLAPQQHQFEHFEITVMNSPKVQGREGLIKIDRETISSLSPELPVTDTMNSYARQWQLKEFLEGREGNSSFASHRNTVQFIDAIYAQLISKIEAGEYVKWRFEDAISEF